MHPDEWANMCERIGVHPADISAAQSDESVLDDRLRRALAKSKTKLSEQHMQLLKEEASRRARRSNGRRSAAAMGPAAGRLSRRASALPSRRESTLGLGLPGVVFEEDSTEVAALETHASVYKPVYVMDNGRMSS